MTPALKITKRSDYDSSRAYPQKAPNELPNGEDHEGDDVAVGHEAWPGPDSNEAGLDDVQQTRTDRDGGTPSGPLIKSPATAALRWHGEPDPFADRRWLVKGILPEQGVA